MNTKHTKERYSYGYAMELQKPFKEREKEFEIPLSKHKYYIIRFDGLDMTRSFKIKHKAINDKFFATMKTAFFSFVRKYPKITFAYSFSDEVSIMFKASPKGMFSRNQKLLSLLTAQLTLEFKKAAEVVGLNTYEKDWIFDARIIGCNECEAINYFKSRQAFAIDKFLGQCKGEYGIDYKLNNSKDIINSLNEKGIDYEELGLEHKYGLVYSSRCRDILPFEFDKDLSALEKII